MYSNMNRDICMVLTSHFMRSFGVSRVMYLEDKSHREKTFMCYNRYDKTREMLLKGCCENAKQKTFSHISKLVSAYIFLISNYISLIFIQENVG